MGVVIIVRLESSFNSSFEIANAEVESIFKNIEKGGLKLDPKLKFILQFVLRELFNNSIEHGNNMDESKRVYYELSISKEYFQVIVSDCGDGFDLESIMDKERQDSIMRKRNRGLSALTDMGFILSYSNKSINAKLCLKEYFIVDERVAEKMEINIEKNIAYCVLNNNLVAANIKELVDILKSKLEGAEANYNSVVIDLTNSESVDSMGITFLIGVYKALAAKEKTVSLKGVSDEMLNLFKIMKLDEIFPLEK